MVKVFLILCIEILKISIRLVQNACYTSMLKRAILIIEIFKVGSSANSFYKSKKNRLNPIFRLQRFFIHHLKAISHIKVMIKIIKVMKTRIINLRDINIIRDLTG